MQAQRTLTPGRLLLLSLVALVLILAYPKLRVVSSNTEIQQPPQAQPGQSATTSKESDKPIEERVGDLETQLDKLTKRGSAKGTSAKPKNQQSPQPVPVTGEEETSPFNAALEEKIAKLENQVNELNKKVEVRPKDFWDKLSVVASALSSIVIGTITVFVTWFLKQREINQLKFKTETEDSDRKAKLELEQLAAENEDRDRRAKLELERLANERAQTQLRVDEANKQTETAIAHAQTVRELLPSLQSPDERTKATALMLIAYLGNPELATKLSGLFETENTASVTSALQAIASIADAKIEDRRQAAIALIRFGQNQQAVEKLIELTRDSKITTQQKQTIAEDLENIGEAQKAATIQLEIASDVAAEVDNRRSAVKALKRLQYVYQARQSLSSVAHSDKADVKSRVVAIEALADLDGLKTTADTFEGKLLDLIQEPRIPPQDFYALVDILKYLGKENSAESVLREIVIEPKQSLVRRLVAIESLKLIQTNPDTEIEAAKTSIFQDILNSPHASPQMILASIEGLGENLPKEQKADILRKIIDSAQGRFQDREKAVSTLEMLGYAEEAEKRRKELVVTKHGA